MLHQKESQIWLYLLWNKSIKLKIMIILEIKLIIYGKYKILI
jgi:hypothetical protein